MSQENRTGSVSDRATLLIATGSATVAFAVGFNFGAFQVIFFDQLLTIWVIATVVFIGSLVSSVPPNTWPRRLILLLPTLWVIAAIVDNRIDLETGERYVFSITVAVTLVALPFVAWNLITAINVEFIELPRAHKGVVVAAVLIAMLVGGLLGARNDLFLTCEDFKVSGNDLPANCVEEVP